MISNFLLFFCLQALQPCITIVFLVHYLEQFFSQYVRTILEIKCQFSLSSNINWTRQINKSFKKIGKNYSMKKKLRSRSISFQNLFWPTVGKRKKSFMYEAKNWNFSKGDQVFEWYLAAEPAFISNTLWNILIFLLIFVINVIFIFTQKVCGKWKN